MKRKRKRRRKSIRRFAVLLAVCMILFAALALTVESKKRDAQPEEVLVSYMQKLGEADYAGMYSMLSEDSRRRISREEFVQKHENIYGGIEAEGFQVEITDINKENAGVPRISYDMEFTTLAGSINFKNQAVLTREKGEYLVEWEPYLIFPHLTGSDTVRVTRLKARRGSILDRDGRVLAGQGTASSVGVIPGKLGEGKEDSLNRLAELLEISRESIDTALSAAWVKDDSFVPLETLDKIDDTRRNSPAADERTLREIERQDALLEIPGVMITDTQIRIYPYREAASMLTGYVQNVTAEDLEEHAGEGYQTDSVIGRSGAELLYENELRGRDGYEIDILNANGEVKEILAIQEQEDGKDVRLTVDGELQSLLYEQFKEDESCTAAVNPLTGEVMALVSTPSYDANDFIRGMSEQKWKELNEDPGNPLYNRFRAAFCPGSIFKPVVGAIGMTTGVLDPEEDFGNVGRRWQADESWGNYYVTTLKAYEPVTLANALLYSDNIYFAKTALMLGADTLTRSLDGLGFNEELPFPIVMTPSSYSSEETITSQIQLADTGYGHGELLVNPLHMACIYTAFLNEGSMLKPRLLYEDAPAAEVWKEHVFTKEAAETVAADIAQVVQNPAGTAYSGHIEGLSLAGKTGTAELKASQDDTTGTEMGWFAVFTTDKGRDDALLMVSMTEDVKERGGSSYTVGKDREVLKAWFGFS